YAPALVADNAAAGREVTLTQRAETTAAAAYGPLLRIAPDPRVVVPALSDAARNLPAGTRYVVTGLRPSRALPLAPNELKRVLATARDADRDAGAAAADRLRGVCRRHRPVAGARRPNRATVPPAPAHRRHRRRDPHRLVADVRHDSTDGVRPRDRCAPAHADRRTRSQLRPPRRPPSTLPY